MQAWRVAALLHAARLYAGQLKRTASGSKAGEPGCSARAAAAGAPRRWLSCSRSRSSGSDTRASTTSCRVLMSARLTSGCFSHTCAPAGFAAEPRAAGALSRGRSRRWLALSAPGWL